MIFVQTVEQVGIAVDCTGIALIVIGALSACVRFVQRTLTRAADAYQELRDNLGRSILIGLEFLVAGDIIKTIVVTPDWKNVLSLAGIVAIRTVLSISLNVEMTGRWPWRQSDSGKR